MSHRSKRYAEARGKIEAGKYYILAEAIALAKQIAGDKTTQAVELHCKLGIDPKKADQLVRGTVDLPHGSGKSPRIAAFVRPELVDQVKAAGADIAGSEELVKELKSTEKIEFDIAVAQPELMKSLAQVAKLLGQKGLMPNPKDETVTTNPVKTVGQLKKGRVGFRSDDSGNVHVMVGRVAFSDEQLTENLTTALDTIKRAKPASAKGTFLKSATLATTFGPGIPLMV